MGEGPPALQKHFSHITKTQFVAEPPKDDEKDDIRRVFEIIEGSAGAFIKNVFASRAAEYPVSEDGFFALFFRRKGCTVWAIHGSLLMRCVFLTRILHEWPPLQNII
jgi:hypothetical protein